MRVAPIATLALVLAGFAWAGCKTEVNTPPPQQTVIREVPVEHTDVVHDSDQPKVENNIKVDH